VRGTMVKSVLKLFKPYNNKALTGLF